jgi:hypothetical protein
VRELKITKIPIITAITALVIATPTPISFPIVTVIATPASPEQASSDAANGTTTTPSSGGQRQTIQIVKDGTNSYVLSGGLSRVGSFDTTYRVAGERSAPRSAENLIITSTIDDFKKSPTIGYIKAVASVRPVAQEPLFQTHLQPPADNRENYKRT